MKTVGVSLAPTQSEATRRCRDGLTTVTQTTKVAQRIATANSGRKRRRWLRLTGLVVGLLLVAALTLAFGPFFRLRSVVVLGGTASQRSDVEARVLDTLGGRHLWAVNRPDVVSLIDRSAELSGALILREFNVRWFGPSLVQIAALGGVGAIQDGDTLTRFGEVIAASGTGRRRIMLCPIDMPSATSTCPWKPRVGDRVGSVLVGVVRSLWQSFEGAHATSTAGSVVVDEVSGVGVVVVLPGSAECVMGAAKHPWAQVTACWTFAAPRSVVNVINPNSPAVLFNDRVG